MQFALNYIKYYFEYTDGKNTDDSIICFFFKKNTLLKQYLSSDYVVYLQKEIK